MHVRKKDRDDLTIIDGIGLARQKWLAEEFGVYTYADLAALPVEEIEIKFKAENKLYSKDQIEQWPLEAAKLAAEKSKLNLSNSAQTAIPNRSNSAVNEIATKKTLPNSVQDGDWQPVATFIAEFQVHLTSGHDVKKRIWVNYHDMDKNQPFEISESEQIGPWMVTQVSDKLDRVTKEVSKAKPVIKVAAEPPSQVRLPVTFTRIHLYQPAGADIELAPGNNGRPYAGILKADQPFTAEANFIIGEGAEVVLGEGEISYRVQFFSQDRQTGKKMHLGDAQPGMLSSGKRDYSAILSGLLLPSGSYRLHIVVVSESENVHPGFFEFQMLRVV